MRRCLTILNIVSAILLMLLGIIAVIGELIGAGNLFDELAKIGISRGVYYVFFAISLVIFLITNFIGSKFCSEK